MIVIHIDTQHDTSLMDALYKNIKEEVKLLYNPTREEIDNVLFLHPTETLLCVGHGSPSGLFGFKGGMAIDSKSVPLLATRETIGIWCNASDFARKHKGVRGYFTDMFISNPSECGWFGYHGHTTEETDEQNVKFSNKISELINEGIDKSQWVDILQEWCDRDIDFVAYNYGISKPNINSMEYFDGTQDEDNDIEYGTLSDLFGDDGKELDETTDDDVNQWWRLLTPKERREVYDEFKDYFF